MMRTHVLLSVTVIMSLFLVSGCERSARDLPLNENVAEESLQKSLQAWVDGQTPDDLKPEITMGDFAWDSGKTLVSFEILTDQQKSDGTNLHIPVKRKFKSDGKESESTVTYIVGTSPVITIFPQ